MSEKRKEIREWIVPKKPARLLVLFAIAVGIFGTDCWYRRWSPDVEIATEHYAVYSTASREDTEKVAEVVEVLWEAYGEVFSGLMDAEGEGGLLKLKLFKDREEFRRCNRGIGWAEAFYRHPYCYAYYPADETSPYHWMVHEAVHQLNREAAGFDLAQWADEGIAEYFSTSEIRGGEIHLGRIDRHTYPIWWLGEMKLSGDVEKDIEDGRIIPLRAVISGSGGPDIDEQFNLYYIHWWSLSHFLFEYEDGRYREGYLKVIEKGGTVESFVEHIGAIEEVQGSWYEYLGGMLKEY